MSIMLANHNKYKLIRILSTNFSRQIFKFRYKIRKRFFVTLSTLSIISMTLNATKSWEIILGARNIMAIVKILTFLGDKSKSFISFCALFAD